ncbi:MAG: DHH family phosphoesterase [Hydrogenovibrio sp.]|uniref:single-stranded-DNA-specific exonuclease RecJ n=1 Tax=Hydrogenovibrio sp. TaxID=2065821 RepID=UPI00287026BF|nr:DHH family phosphoesterase [Hydrogenovibrio sp.]MDR9497663.1 DHH family phosphoesterase [Hydrogenovibrio sp.]
MLNASPQPVTNDPNPSSEPADAPTEERALVERACEPSIYQAALSLGLTPLQAHLAGCRLTLADLPPQSADNAQTLVEAIQPIVRPRLQHLQPPTSLHQAKQAGQLIADAVQSQGKIVLATDYDTDGVTSASIAARTLMDFFGVGAERIVPVISERQHGYGINDNTVERILAIEPPVALVLSADQGSSDEPRIARLKQAGLRVCVTDHHQIPSEGPPASADCVVNPQHPECDYDTRVAGCYVIFLVMSQARQELIDRGHLPADTPSLKPLLDLVALGTVADSVSLKSANNRAVVSAGLKAINQNRHPVWQALAQFQSFKDAPVDAEYLGFQVATRINAASRVSDVNTAFAFLNAVDTPNALTALQRLDADNHERRAQQAEMLQKAEVYAQSIYHPGKFSLCLPLQGNAGIQGIIATRIGESYYRPTLAMTDLNDGTLAGSGRAIVPEVNLKQAFETIAEANPGLFRSLGGHSAAAGCMIEKSGFEVFAQAFEEEVARQLDHQRPIPKLDTDGHLAPQQLTLQTVNEIEQLAPFGREWPKPHFYGDFIVAQHRWIGQTRTHAVLQLQAPDGKRHDAIWFNAIAKAGEPFPFALNSVVRCVYELSCKRFRGRESLQLKIVHMNLP